MLRVTTALTTRPLMPPLSPARSRAGLSGCNGMRDDEFMWEPFGSAMRVTMRAGLDADGNVVDWHHELWSYPHSRRPGGREGVNLLAASYLSKPWPSAFPTELPLPNGGSDRNAIPIYDFPNQKILKHYAPEAPLRTSSAALAGCVRQCLRNRVTDGRSGCGRGRRSGGVSTAASTRRACAGGDQSWYKRSGYKPGHRATAVAATTQRSRVAA